MNTAENEIVLLQHYSLNSMIHSTLHSLQWAKLQFPLQNEVVPLTSKNLQNFPGKKPFLLPTFEYLSYNSRPFGLPPTCDFPVPQTFPVLHLLAPIHDWLGNFRVFQNSTFAVKLSVFLHAVSFWPISCVLLQLIDKHHSLGWRYKTT